MGKGRPPTVSDDQILRRKAEEEDFDFVFTSELREALDFSTNSGIHKRLDALEREGFVRSKRSTNANAWLLTEAGKERIKSDD